MDDVFFCKPLENTGGLEIYSLYSKYSRFFFCIYCSMCSALLPENANYCHKCGKPVVKLVTPRIIRKVRITYIAECPRCGHKNDVKAKRCHGCDAVFYPPLFSNLSTFPFPTIINKIEKDFLF